MKNSLIIVIAIFALMCMVMVSMTACGKKTEEIESPAEIEKPVEEEPKDVVDDTKKILYADDSGNTYEIIKYITATDGRNLVLFQNVETQAVSLAVRNYFEQHYHKISG